MPITPATLPQHDTSKLHSDLSMVDSFCSPPSVFIEAPPESDPIDTVDVARRVRDVLERHKISQTLFSKYVIKRSQGTTSDLLRCPKQWERMSEEGRVPYRRMKAWLEGDLQHNLQVLLRIKQGLDVPALPPKCNRTKFSDEQKEALESFLSQNPRLTHDTLEQFATEQNLTISAVRNWVNNRKQRMKRGSSTGFDESPGKYIRFDGSEDLDDGGFPTRQQEYDSSSINGIETEGVPTMVTSAPYNQEKVAQSRVSTEFEATRVSAEFDASSFDGVKKLRC
ncbi:homeobox protein cut-like 1 [Dendronephthya gigantea]|uniref:homeobox protein cut-like 1 n=1 Tax=Dendronephthya gigantea TaxID=151771 RepID=UPI00106A34E8|nr:homeobox protein cut-like 1 [Dendronephthya gigantea]